MKIEIPSHLTPELLSDLSTDERTQLASKIAYDSYMKIGKDFVSNPVPVRNLKISIMTNISLMALVDRIINESMDDNEKVDPDDLHVKINEYSLTIKDIVFDVLKNK